MPVTPTSKSFDSILFAIAIDEKKIADIHVCASAGGSLGILREMGLTAILEGITLLVL